MELNHDLDKLSMLDAHGHKMNIIPAEVKGHFRNYRNITELILVLFFLLLPWTKINGAQSLLIDLPHRKFAVLGLTFFAHDGPLIFFILAILAFSLAATTALFGRAWCGWACPQTVFIDGIYRRIERIIEGNYIARRQLESAPMSLNKFLRRSLKWILFVLVSTVIAHSFLAYFVGSEDLLKMVQADPRLNWTPFIFVALTTAALSFNFGWFREQFCIIMCPYGRFQSVLLDKHSITVAYDSKRGEPRKNSPEYSQQKGDCVSCNRCVQVCPTGIDIRDGAQMECIACTACIDACDEIMTKIGKPKGLIRYASLASLTTGIKTAGLFNKPRIRVLVYLSFIVIAISGLTYNLANRSPLEVFILRGKETPFSLSVDNQGHEILINHMRLHLKNQTFEDMNFELKEPLEWNNLQMQITVPERNIHLGPGEFKMIHFFVSAPRTLVKGSGQFATQLSVNGVLRNFTLVGPAQ